MAPSVPARRALPMLDSVRVASPCSADWTQMVGDEKVRFCTSCEKNVYNLSAMTSADAEDLLGASAGGELCVRFYQRVDGTVMTSDCPVGVTRKRRKKLALAIAGAGALAWGAVAQLDRRTMGVVPMTGEIAMQGELPPATTPATSAAPPAVHAIPTAMGTVTASPPLPPAPLMGATSGHELLGKVAVTPPPPPRMGGIRPAEPTPPAPQPVKMGRRAPLPTER